MQVHNISGGYRFLKKEGRANVQLSNYQFWPEIFFLNQPLILSHGAILINCRNQ